MPGARTDCNSDKRLLSPPGHICCAASPKFTSVIILNGELMDSAKNKIQIKWVSRIDPSKNPTRLSEKKRAAPKKGSPFLHMYPQ